ncbi:MAG TPA: hypothetical protein VHK03_03195 [Aestuariivirgaceae bacterium]|jgi:hypothetical protein|nr:hypothetical protein [Aestuariivirgaceae bacterium]
MVRSTSREDGEAAFKGLQKQPETGSEASADAGEDLRSKVERLKELRMAKTTNDEDGGAPEQPVDLFMFKSQSRQGLHAFTGDRAGEQLPRRFRPWQAQGMIDRNQAPPHALSRSAIERSIRDNGFQLWRIRGQSAPKE